MTWFYLLLFVACFCTLFYLIMVDDSLSTGIAFPIKVLGVLLFFVATVISMINTIESFECSNLADRTGHDTKYTFLKCHINIDNIWYSRLQVVFEEPIVEERIVTTTTLSPPPKPTVYYRD